MLKLNIKKLMDTISEAEAYSRAISESAGVKYLCEKFYMPIADGRVFQFSDIDFDEFDLDDVGDFEDYYRSELSEHNNTAACLHERLSKMLPKASKANFI